MSDAISGARPNVRSGHGVSLAGVLLVSLICFAILLIIKAPNPLTVDVPQLRIDTDDAMRLAQVQDFLNGQGWFDLHQYRLGAEGEAPMHWSRVIDAPLALLVRGFEAFVDREQAVLAAAVTWPLFGAFLYILVSLAIAARVAGYRGLICTALIALPYVLLDPQLQPGRVDYHGQQTVLMLTMALLLISGGGRAWLSGLAGLVACLSLSIGVANSPVILMAAAMMAGRWVLEGRQARRDAAAFLGSLALGAPVAMLLTVPPDQWGVAWCDALSIAFALVFFIGAGIAGLAALALPADGPRSVRIAALVFAGLATTAVTFAAFPECVAGPYAHLDAETREWVGRRAEARNIIWALSQQAGGYTHRITLWPLIGLFGLALGALLAPKGRRYPWVLLFSLAFMGWIISLFQIRGIRISLPFAAIGAGYLLACIACLKGVARVVQPVAFLFVWWTQTPFAGYLFDKTPEAADGASAEQIHQILKQCTFPEQMAPLAALPNGRIATSIEFGSYVLLRTPHWVLASPHHRNFEGNLAAIQMIKADRETTYRMLEQWRIDYVVICDGWPANIANTWLTEQTLPPWLQPLPSVEPLHLYRFVP